MSIWLERWKEFFRITGLHGYKYIVLSGLTYKERICWAVAVTFFLITSIILVWIAWDWNASNPTLTVIESTHYAIQNYPFPAVTVCDMNGVSRSMALKTANTLKRPENVSVQDLFGFLKYATSLLGSFAVSADVHSNLTLLQQVLDINNMSVEKLMREITPSCRDMIRRCLWKRIMYSCDLLFVRVLTTDGLCCSFNYFAMTLSNMTRRTAMFTPPKPRKVASCGFSTGLTFLTEIRPADYYSTMFASYGLRIFVHDSYNYPDENSQIRLVSPNTEVLFAVTPETTYSTDAVRAFPADSRRCVFTDERRSSVFLRYSYHNCLFECRAYIIHGRCGCMPYFIPKSGTYRTCNFRDIKCLNNAKEQYGSATPGLTSGNETSQLICDCKHDCQNYNYVLDVATGRLTRRGSYNSQTFFKEIKLANHSVVNVFFNDLVSIRYRRDVYLNWHNLLASFGGLLSLFVGFSFVSGFEFVYFFSIRIMFECFTKRRKTHPKNEKIEIEETHNSNIAVITKSFKNFEPVKQFEVNNYNQQNLTRIPISNWMQNTNRKKNIIVVKNKNSRNESLENLNLFQSR